MNLSQQSRWPVRTTNTYTANANRPLAAGVRVMASVILLLTTSGSGFAQQTPDSMTFWQARKELRSSLATEIPCPYVKRHQKCDPQERVGATVTAEELKFSGPVFAWPDKQYEDNLTVRLAVIKKVVSFKEFDHYTAFVEFGPGRLRYYFEWPAQQDANRFAEAVQWLASHSSEVKSSLVTSEDFNAQAAAWRNVAAKPPMPENAREHKVLAEDAVQRKDFDKAIDEYLAAASIFPMWPEGQFNLALICGETGDYDCAVEHMQNYLELVPDAPDAQAAKDKLIIWRDKLGSSSTVASR
jgi:tetratricopeptide (TPR) repeat protein